MSPLVGLVAAIAVAAAVYPQVDLTLRRQFKLRDRLSLRALGASLRSGGQNGGLSPLYQVGGPRSIQLALNLQF